MLERKIHATSACIIDQNFQQLSQVSLVSLSVQFDHVLHGVPQVRVGECLFSIEFRDQCEVLVSQHLQKLRDLFDVSTLRVNDNSKHNYPCGPVIISFLTCHMSMVSMYCMLSN